MRERNAFTRQNADCRMKLPEMVIAVLYLSVPPVFKLKATH